METRICMVCGKPMVDGMTDCHEFYAHESCFEKAMDETFPDGWRESDGMGRLGGYYESFHPLDGTWRDTGIFYTEWEEEE